MNSAGRSYLRSTNSAVIRISKRVRGERTGLENLAEIHRRLGLVKAHGRE